MNIKQKVIIKILEMYLDFFLESNIFIVNRLSVLVDWSQLNPEV